MSENNVENTSFKIDDVSEEKSQFEIDNERRAQLEKERSKEYEEQGAEAKEEEQEEEQVEEQAPIHISHKTQIVDNFFDGPPPARKAPNQNQQTQNTNVQSSAQDGNVQVNNTLQQNATDNNVKAQSNIQQNQVNNQSQQAVNNEARVEIKTETKVEPPPPIKLPKHDTVIVDNNLDMPRKKVVPANVSQNPGNPNQNAQSTSNNKNAQTQVQGATNNNQNVQVQNQTQSQTQSQTQNTATVKNAQSNVSAQPNHASVTNNQVVNNEVKAEAKVEPLPPIKLPKHDTVIVDNNLDMPRKKVVPANVSQNAGNANQNAQSTSNNQNAQTQVQGATNNNQNIQVQNQTQSQTQNTATVKNAQSNVNAQPNHASVTNNQVVNHEVKAETKVEPPPIKLPKHDTVIVDNNLDMPRKKVTPANASQNAGSANQNAQSTSNNQNLQSQTQNVNANNQNMQAEVQNQTQSQVKNTATVQNVPNKVNVQQNQANSQNQQVETNEVKTEIKAETEVEPSQHIKLPKHETVIVDNNLDVATGKKNKKNKKAGKNANANKNVAKQSEVKATQQSSSNADKIAENKEYTNINVVNAEKSVQNKPLEAKDAKTDSKLKDDNVQNNEISQEVKSTTAVEVAMQQAEKPKVEEIDKKANSIHENDISSNVRRPQIVSQGITEIISLITPEIYAGFGIRCVAFVIDTLFVIGLMNIALYFGIESYIPISIGIVYMILFAFYSFIFVYLFDGQTIGKMITGIKVVEDSGRKLGLFTAFVREFAGKIIMIPLFILFIFTVFSYKKHSLMDYLSDTSVIKCKFAPLYDELRSEIADQN